MEELLRDHNPYVCTAAAGALLLTPHARARAEGLNCVANILVSFDLKLRIMAMSHLRKSRFAIRDSARHASIVRSLTSLAIHSDENLRNAAVNVLVLIDTSVVVTPKLIRFMEAGAADSTHYARETALSLRKSIEAQGTRFFERDGRWKAFSVGELSALDPSSILFLND